MSSWYVYILQCSDDRLYVGMTDNVERRFEEHRSGKGGFFTRTVGVEKLLYNEEFSTRLEAHKRESQLKGWTKRKKLALINGDLKLLKKL